jgi:prepilin-type N-terminal cleavage/methylation domain-containing protein
MASGGVFFLREKRANHTVLRADQDTQPKHTTYFPVRKGFTLPELLAVLALVGILAALSYPAWRVLLTSGARRVGEARVMEALEHSRSMAISSGKEVWLVMRHDEAKQRDAGRIMVRSGKEILPEGGWDQLPPGITFLEGSGAITDVPPPLDIREAAVNSRSGNDHLGAVMFLRSGSIGWPKTGACSLSIPIDSKNGTSVITLSRGTGKAVITRTR